MPRSSVPHLDALSVPHSNSDFYVRQDSGQGLVFLRQTLKIKSIDAAGTSLPLVSQQNGLRSLWPIS